MRHKTDRGRLADHWGAYRTAQKIRRANRYQIRVAEIQDLATIGFAVVAISDSQFRINNRVDVYLVHNQYRDRLTGKRGGYWRVTDFIKAFFKDGTQYRG